MRVNLIDRLGLHLEVLLAFGASLLALFGFLLLLLLFRLLLLLAFTFLLLFLLLSVDFEALGEGLSLILV